MLDGSEDEWDVTVADAFDILRDQARLRRVTNCSDETQPSNVAVIGRAFG